MHCAAMYWCAVVLWSSRSCVVREEDVEGDQQIPVTFEEDRKNNWELDGERKERGEKGRELGRGDILRDMACCPVSERASQPGAEEMDIRF